MSAEARMKELIDDIVYAALTPLERAVEDLSARLAAVEGDSGAKSAAPVKRAAGGRTAKAKAAEVTAITGDGVKTERVPEQREGGE